MVDAVTSASVVEIICDTAVQWDCNLPILFEKIERARFIYNVVTPIVFLVYIGITFWLPLFLLNKVKTDL